MGTASDSSRDRSHTDAVMKLIVCHCCIPRLHRCVNLSSILNLAAFIFCAQGIFAFCTINDTDIIVTSNNFNPFGHNLKQKNRKAYLALQPVAQYRSHLNARTLFYVFKIKHKPCRVKRHHQLWRKEKGGRRGNVQNGGGVEQFWIAMLHFKSKPLAEWKQIIS